MARGAQAPRSLARGQGNPVMIRLFCFALAICLGLSPAQARSDSAPLQALLQAHAGAVANPSRATVDVLLAALLDSELPAGPEFLERWRDKGVFQRTGDGLFYYGRVAQGGYALSDIDSGADLGQAESAGITELRPNAGVRRAIGLALVRFQLLDPDPARRIGAVEASARSPAEDKLEPLREAIEDEPDAAIKARKIRLERLLAARFAASAAERIAAIESLRGDLGVDARAVLNQILTTTPSIVTEPSTRAPGITSCIRFRVRRNVDLPQPDGPMSAVTDRGSIVIVTSATARTGP